VDPGITPSSQSLIATAGVEIAATSAFTITGLSGPFTYSVTPALPSGLTLDPSSGVISGTAVMAQAERIYTISVTGIGARETRATARTTIAISVKARLIADAITADKTLTAVAGRSFVSTIEYQLTGFDGTVRFSISPSLPAGMSIAPTTGALRGIPENESPKTEYLITATGSKLGTASVEVSLAVVEALSAPSSVTAVGGDASAVVSWSAVPGATGYQVSSIPQGATCTVTGTQAQCTGLVNGSTYSFKVVPINDAGVSRASRLSSAVMVKAAYIDRSRSLTIRFRPDSRALSNAQIRQLRNLASVVAADQGIEAKVSVGGFRAQQVARVLRNSGLEAAITVTNDGLVPSASPKSRRVVVELIYRAVNG
jgi:hypothetical protein